jgi:GT2 family glycosyltransferase
MQNKNTLISVIICTFNTKKVTLACLDHLKKSIDYLGKPVETIVIENGTDGTGDVIKKNYKWIKLLEPKENTGFTKGNNLGIKFSDKFSRFFLLINSDTFVRKDTLQDAVNYMANHLNCDILGCRLRLENGKVQQSGGYLPTPISVVTWFWGMNILPGVAALVKPFHPRNRNFFKTDREIGWVMGAFMFIRGEVVRKTKGYDENLFMYTEEVDWCKRIHDAGYKIRFTPSFEVTHLDKSSSKNNLESLRKVFIAETTGVIYFIKKYYAQNLWWLIPVIKIGLFTRVIAFTIVPNKNRRIAYLEALKTI